MKKGRPKVSYQTKMIRVPLPILNLVKEIVAKFKNELNSVDKK